MVRGLERALSGWVVKFLRGCVVRRVLVARRDAVVVIVLVVRRMLTGVVTVAVDCVSSEVCWLLGYKASER
jgi:hypothetical protein